MRDLRWIGESRVLVVSSQTRSISSLGVPRSELFFGQMVDLDTQKVVQVLTRTPDVLAVLYGPASVRNTSDGDTVFVRAVSVSKRANTCGSASRTVGATRSACWATARRTRSTSKVS